MNRICRDYLKDIKKFFPYVGKKEQQYIDGIAVELEELIQNEKISTKFDLYEKYRQPYNVANDYYSSCDTSVLLKKIKLAKYIKRVIVFVIFAALISTGSYVCYKIDIEKERARVSMVNSTTLISDPDEPDPEAEGLRIYSQMKSIDSDTSEPSSTQQAKAEE